MPEGALPEAIGHHELLVLHSPDERWVGRCVPLDGRRIVFGRHPEAQFGLRVRDPCMSRNHAVLFPAQGSEYYIVEDAGSKNQSFVNGQAIVRMHLGPNSVLRVGHTVMLHRHVPAGAPRPGSSAGSKDRITGDPLARIVGPSYATAALRASLTRVSTTKLTVLIEGDTGTGKELVASVVHQLSGRQGPFHAINCSTIPADLAESEFFGDSRQGDTSLGHFGAANRGTLFLDEVAALPFPAQPILLRALESSGIRPVGTTRSSPVDVRIVASTNADLDVHAAGGTFRPDLHARLQEWPVHIPPLRDRPDDVIALAYHFLAQQRSQLRLTADVAEAFLLYEWPYNVRELQKLVRRLCLLCEGATIPLASCPEKMQRPLQERKAYEATNGTADMRPSESELRSTLDNLGGNVTLVARHYGKGRKQVYRWLAHYGIDPSAYRR